MGEVDMPMMSWQVLDKELKGQESGHTEIEYLRPEDSSEDCFKGRLGGSIIYHEHQE